MIALCFILLMTLAVAQDQIEHRRWVKKVERLTVHAHLTRDGQIITISFDNVVRIIDAETGRLVKTFRRSPNLVTPFTLELLVAYSGDGRYVLYGWVEGDGAGTSLYWGESLSPILIDVGGSGDYASSLVVSPDGELVGFVGEFGGISLRDRNTGEPLPWAEKEFSKVEAAAFSPDSRRLAVSMNDTVYLVDIRSGELVRMFEGVGPLSSMAFSPNGRYFAMGGGVLIRMWSCATGELVRTLEVGSLNEEMSFSPDGQYIVCDGVSGVSLWDVEREVCLWSRHPGNGRIEYFSFSLDGRQLIGLTDGGQLYRWTLAGDGRLVSIQMLSKNGWVG
ncbi:MAG: WD40 repeat domain-containing protein [Acidobacteriia bacterium]|nr:WD40 repeat domain-containing protein [Terriglobia bacterium]